MASGSAVVKNASTWPLLARPVVFYYETCSEDRFNRVPTENDARGWLLLEHLAALERFEETPGNPLSGRLDLSRIALMGHSRGGEAAAVAAAFDAVARYPDDATVELPGPFGVDAVVAFAPADGQYRPAGQRTPLAGVGYLVLQGGHDSDVSSFVGARQLERVRFAPGSGRFAAGVWIYGANHGQWNTTWGDRDLPWPWAGFLDRAALLPAGEQRRIARVYVTAFLDETLRGDGQAPGPYRRLFRQPEAAPGWIAHHKLPEDVRAVTELPLTAMQKLDRRARGPEP